MPSPGERTLPFDREKRTPIIKAHDMPHTILIDMSWALSSGDSAIGNPIDPMISIPGSLLPAGCAACRES